MVDGALFMPQKFFIMIVLLVSVGLSVTAYGKYVRKQLQPDFFMPKEVQFNQPEKLPPLPKKEALENVSVEIIDVVDNLESIQKESVQFYVPDYQKKFDDYNRDISYINRSGEIPVNSSLKADLDQMNSDEIFEVQKKELGPESQVSRAFMDVLDKVLAEN